MLRRADAAPVVQPRVPVDGSAVEALMTALDREVKIRALRLSGWSVPDVARECLVSPEWVERVCDGCLTVARSGGAPFAEARQGAAKRLLDQGATVKQVAYALHLSGMQVRRASVPAVDRAARLELIRRRAGGAL